MSNNVYKWVRTDNNNNKMDRNNNVETSHKGSLRQTTYSNVSANTRLLRPPNNPIMPYSTPKSTSPNHQPRQTTYSGISANDRLRRTPNEPYTKQELAAGIPLGARTMTPRPHPPPPEHCICDRPSAMVVCGICSNRVMNARVRMRCVQHPNAVFLQDMNECGQCGCEKERYLKEV